MHWVIQTDVFGEEETERFIEAVRKSGSPFTLVDKNVDWFSLPSFDFIFRGSLEGYERIKKYDHPYFIHSFRSSSYFCSNYYPHLDNLLNSDYIILPKGDLKRNKDLIFRCFGGRQLFLRPNSGEKVFTGTTLWKRWFNKELDIIFTDNPTDNSELVLISSYKDVKNECRVLVGPNGIISYSIYEGNFKEGVVEKVIDELNYSPDDFFTVDIDLDRGKIIELNSFNCAGLYDCDFNQVVFDINKYFGVYF